MTVKCQYVNLDTLIVCALHCIVSDVFYTAELWLRMHELDTVRSTHLLNMVLQYCTPYCAIGSSMKQYNTHNHFTALFPGLPSEPVLEEIFWTLWCKGGYQKQTHRQSGWGPLHPD